MEYVFRFLEGYWAYLIPVTIFLFVLWFFRKSYAATRRMRMMIEREELMHRVHLTRERKTEEEGPSPIKQLLGREDVTLRVLEEVYEMPRYAYRRESSSPDSQRLRVLDRIQDELRQFLRSAIKEADFPQVRDRTLTLLDQINQERAALQHKEPFNDIHDPERSLLIDIFEEIDPTRTIVRQKAFQLANIIKIKHQDLLKLQAENAKAAIWTKWGTSGTVVFGILSVILSILTING